MLLHYDATHPGLRRNTSVVFKVHAQEAAPAISFDPRYIDRPLPPGLTQLLVGCVPAAIVATLNMPEAADRRALRWFLLLEILSLPVWFWLGLRAEKDRLLAWALATFWLGRVLALFWTSVELASTPLALFWLLLTAYLLVGAVLTAVTKLRRDPSALLGTKARPAHPLVGDKRYGESRSDEGVRPPWEPD